MATSVRERVGRAVTRVVRAVTGEQTTKRPPSPFDKWDFEKGDKAIDDAFDAQTIDVTISGEQEVVPAAGGTPMFFARRSSVNPIQMNRLFFQGDHWQNGDGWIGPHPERENQAFNEAMQEIANIFTSKNVVRETVIRHSLGVVGRNIQWGFTPVAPITSEDGKPPEEIQAKIKEAENLIRPWLQNRKVATLLRDAVCTLLLSERAGIQLVIPPGLADKDGEGSLVIRAATIADALNFIYPEHPIPDNACVILDQMTKQEAGLWRYTAGEDDQGNELVAGETRTTTPDEEVDYVAICFVDQDGDTVIRVFREGGDSPEAESFLEMGQRIPMFEMRRAALITTQVQQAQRALNLAETMIPRTAITSGFMERVMIDAQLPGEPEVDAEGNETGRWIEKPFYTGAGTTNFLESSEFEDEEGKLRSKRADVKWREPISADGPIKASDKHYRSILDEVSQLHVVMAGDSNPSGTSRLTARIEYLATLQLTQGEVESAFRFIVDTALAMAEALAQKPGEYTNVLRTQCACRLDAGPLLPAERAAIEASIGKTISQETAMMLVGVEDVDAEKARMAMDPMSRASFGSTVGDALNKLTAPGAPVDGAARFIGLSETMIKILLTGDPAFANPEPADPNPTSGGRDPKKPAPEPRPPVRGPALGGPPKKDLPAPATSSTGVTVPGART
jgi:hypothetical protein